MKRDRRNIIIVAILMVVSSGLLVLVSSALDIQKGNVDQKSNTINAQPKITVSLPVEIKMYAITENPRVGDQVEVLVEITTEPGVILAPIVYGKKLGEWEVLQVKVGSGTVIQDKFKRQDKLVLQTFVPGKLEVPAIIQKFVDPAGQAAEFRSAPLIITVTPLPTRPGDQAGKIRGLKKPRSMISWWLLGTMLFVLAIISALAAWLIYRRQKSLAATQPITSLRPAEIIAQERLAWLKANDILNTQGVKNYYIELSDIIRRYLERQYEIPAIDLTTHELIRALRTTPLKRTELSAVKDILEQSDMVKFAKFVPTSETPNQDWQKTQELVERTAAQIASIQQASLAAAAGEHT